MSVAFFILITACVVAYSLSPLLRPEEQWITGVDTGARRRALEAEKKSSLRAMKDVEFEHASNKINDEDYASLRRHYGARAAKSIRALELLAKKDATVVTVENELNRGKSAAAKKTDTTHDYEIMQVKEEMEILEQEWDRGAIDDDEYVTRYDNYTEDLEGLLAKKKAGVQS